MKHSLSNQNIQETITDSITGHRAPVRFFRYDVFVQVYRRSLPGSSAPVSDEQEILLFLFPLLAVWPVPACVDGLTLPPPSGEE